VRTPTLLSTRARKIVPNCQRWGLATIGFEDHSRIAVSELVSHGLTAHRHSMGVSRVSADDAMKLARVYFYVRPPLACCPLNLRIEFGAKVF
jgi:hypothetical protein